LGSSTFKSALMRSRTYFDTCNGMVNSAVELTAVLANPAPVEASWCVLCPYRSGFEGCGVIIG
jgi:hypothetical protein